MIEVGIYKHCAPNGAVGVNGCVGTSDYQINNCAASFALLLKQLPNYSTRKIAKSFLGQCRAWPALTGFTGEL